MLTKRIHLKRKDLQNHEGEIIGKCSSTTDRGSGLFSTQYLTHRCAKNRFFTNNEGEAEPIRLASTIR